MKKSNFKKLGISLLAVSTLGVVATVTPAVGTLSPVVVYAEEAQSVFQLWYYDYTTRVNTDSKPGVGMAPDYKAIYYQNVTVPEGQTVVVSAPTIPGYKVMEGSPTEDQLTYIAGSNRGIRSAVRYEPDPGYVAPTDPTTPDSGNTNGNTTTPEDPSNSQGDNGATAGSGDNTTTPPADNTNGGGSSTVTPPVDNSGGDTNTNSGDNQNGGSDSIVTPPADNSGGNTAGDSSTNPPANNDGGSDSGANNDSTATTPPTNNGGNSSDNGGSSTVTPPATNPSEQPDGSNGKPAETPKADTPAPKDGGNKASSTQTPAPKADVKSDKASNSSSAAQPKAGTPAQKQETVKPKEEKAQTTQKSEAKKVADTAALPHTGEQTSMLALIGSVLAGAVALVFGFRRRKN